MAPLSPTDRGNQRRISTLTNIYKKTTLSCVLLVVYLKAPLPHPIFLDWIHMLGLGFTCQIHAESRIRNPSILFYFLIKECGGGVSARQTEQGRAQKTFKSKKDGQGEVNGRKLGFAQLVNELINLTLYVLKINKSSQKTSK